MRGRSHKFINNDGQAVDIGDHPSEEVVEFNKKCQALSRDLQAIPRKDRSVRPARYNFISHVISSKELQNN